MKKAVCTWIALVLSATAFAAGSIEEAVNSKISLTPVFWEQDPDAGFEDEGRMHCAPTAVSDGLIYLAQHRKEMSDLVPGVSHRSQIELIKELARDFGTDPSIGGTNPDRILTGLRSYAEKRGYRLSRLEVETWRRISADNKQFKVATKPDIGWMRKAAHDTGTVTIFNFGWYLKGRAGGYKRNGGHWVVVLDTGKEGSAFIVHNPLLQPSRQAAATQIGLSLIDKDLVVATNEIGNADLKGYYEAAGPGLPHDKTLTPILDAVIVFSLSKAEENG